MNINSFREEFRVFCYDKKKHWLSSIFIDTETWIITSRNCMGNDIGPQLLRLEKLRAFPDQAMVQAWKFPTNLTGVV